ncbi:LysM peptidoglycan-binding domain-containing protein [Aquabacterium lacunae]|uniref:LysM peptidoglycan-binding domain-containing protein n=1 Tax=Aquabacterium lacunae TaxID=2528630 RepID=A0A4Q9H0D6_9BURK|nr:LysM peptidoglycan-binding domain-containing protein [Aquabacterium lacunae]TBO32739.1 LysM peptidoglycan-binding domain-containing protein [Aquabacterium lacunae]
MARFVAASFDRPTLTVDYLADDGSHFLRSGGTIAWRFNNPGNIRPAPTNASLRIGTGKTASGEFCIFPSYEIGRRAKKELLRRKYNAYTIPEAMEIYAPRSENDTDAYIEHIVKKTGLPRDKALSSFSDQQLDAMMRAMESREGFNAKADTRKEKWVHATQLTLSDGARPIAGEDVKVDYSGKEYVVRTNGQGAIPPIVHLSENVSVEISLKNLSGIWECVYEFVTGKASRQLLATVDQQRYHGTARMSSQEAKPKSAADQKPLVYVVQSGDNLTKIAQKFKTTVAELRKNNQGIVKGSLIFPGQKINVYGPAGAKAASAVTSSEVAKVRPKAAEPTKPVVSGKGQPLALVDPAQRRAPWMEVAIREAKQWAGYHESKKASDTKNKKGAGSKGVISDNYHKEVGVVVGERTPTMETAWCASFVNYCLKERGFSFTRDPNSQFAARSKKFIKIGAPIYGAIVVYKHTNPDYGNGHTAFILSSLGGGDYAVLGGNQGESITLNSHLRAYMGALGCKLVGFFVPIEYAQVSSDILSSGGDLVEVRKMADLKSFIGDGTGDETKTT